MSFPYCAQNVVDFYNTVGHFSKTLSLPHNIFEGDQTKFSRKDTHLPFSILALQSAQESEGKRLFILSNMSVGEAGTFGHIKVGYPITSNRTVDFTRPTAIKISHHDGSISSTAKEFMESIFRDVYSTGQVEPHFAKYFDLRSNKIKTDNIPKVYYTIPLYCGKDLFSFIEGYDRSSESIPLPLTLNIMYQLSQELKKIHDLGYVHLDIKLENIIIYYNAENNTLTLRLIDFDMLLKEGMQINTRKGTADYMAPEIGLASEIGQPYFINKSMDIYSLGRTFQFLINYSSFFGGVKALGFGVDIENAIEDLVDVMLMDSDVNRPDIKKISEKIEDIFRMFPCEKMNSPNTIDNSSLLPPSLDPYIQLMVNPRKEKSETQIILEPTKLSNITNLRRKRSPLFTPTLPTIPEENKEPENTTAYPVKRRLSFHANKDLFQPKRLKLGEEKDLLPFLNLSS